MKNMLWDGSLDPETKARRFGMDALSDSEVLSLILRTGTKEKSAVGVASELLAYRGRQFYNLMDLSVKELRRFEGIGGVKALQLKAIAEISRRMSKAKLRSEVDFSDDKTIADYYMELMRYETQELLVVALFDVRGKYIEDKVVSKGTLNFTLFSPREVFSYAIRGMGSYVVILHNHPSGDPAPSKDDIKATDLISKCGDMLGIPLIDHIIIGDNVYFSFHRAGLLNNTDSKK